MVVFALTCAVCHTEKCYFESTEVIFSMVVWHGVHEHAPNGRHIKLALPSEKKCSILWKAQASHFQSPHKAPTCRFDSDDPTRELQKEPFCVREGYHRLCGRNWHEPEYSDIKYLPQTFYRTLTIWYNEKSITHFLLVGQPVVVKNNK